MSSPSVSISETGGVTVVAVPDGCMLDGEAIQQVGKQLFDLVEKEGKQRLVIDFADVRFMSSQALGVLLTLRRKAEKSGAIIALAGINEKLMRVFEITNLDKMFTFCADRDEALAHFGAAAGGRGGEG